MKHNKTKKKSVLYFANNAISVAIKGFPRYIFEEISIFINHNNIDI